ncbi:conserved hypothetical protein [Ricinus communis]|uniref:Uncharacterized protein n=1 Tax=Ricinus communis TaxID=3988 RepID=B9S0Q2_RICCO|nr:conserved hypothetical protein [Ricinus communis]
MASAVVEFGKAMAEARRVEPVNDILKNTFNSVLEMYNNLTSSQKEKPTASRNQDQDDDFLSDLKFLEAAIMPDEESGENQPNEEAQDPPQARDNEPQTLTAEKKSAENGKTFDEDDH